MLQEITIKKVKLKKDGEKLEIEFQESGAIKATTDKVCKNQVHPDLRKAVSGLAVHLAILTEYITEKQSKDEDQIEKFTCTGYSIGGKEDQEGFVITGYRKTKRGGIVTLNTPFTRFEESDETAYILMQDVQNKIDTIDAEVRQYLFHGKQAQASIEFPEDEPITNIQIAEPEPSLNGGSQKASKNGRKKVQQTAENPSGEA